MLVMIYDRVLSTDNLDQLVRAAARYSYVLSSMQPLQTPWNVKFRQGFALLSTVDSKWKS